MDVGTIYPTMEEFKMAVRQYAINKEFDLVQGSQIRQDIDVIASQVVTALGN